MNKNLETLKKLKVLLGDQVIVLTGSTALSIQGLVPESQAKDLDLLIYGLTETNKEILDRLQKDNPYKRFVPGGVVQYSFIYEGTKVDIWLKSGEVKPTKLKFQEGILVSSVAEIVKSKEDIGRPKDFLQLLSISRQVFKRNKFENALMDINNTSED